MNLLVYHVASGQVFFTGIVLIIAAALASRSARPLAKRMAGLLFLLAVVAIAISSTAIPYWCYALAMAATLPWLLSGYRKEWQRWAPYCLIVGWVFAAALEVAYHITPPVRPAKQRSLTVIGDSVTAGVDGSETSETWPKIFAREHRMEVQDISHVGETAASALKRVRQHPPQADVMVVEIGGNDLLGSTTSAEFERDLSALLSELAAPDRQIIMFELPLPPFCHEYGRAQRTAAAKHHIALLPKRIFLSILASDGATLDTIHLSQAGHKKMSDTVWQLVGPAFADQ